MARYEIRPLCSDDYPTVMKLEEEVFGAAGEAVLGPYYVKLCCEFFAQTCLLALVSGEPAGYVLSFVRGREAYCTTLAVVPRFQGSRVAIRLVASLTVALEPLVDSCWFTVKRDNASARALHGALGAKDVEVRSDFSTGPAGSGSSAGTGPSTRRRRPASCSGSHRRCSRCTASAWRCRGRCRVDRRSWSRTT